MDQRRRAVVVTVSDGVSQGTREDQSGEAASALLADAGFEVSREVVPDERPMIEATLRRLIGHNDLVVTTGGTGFGPRDVTPEATEAVIEREAPGLAELMRAAGLAKTPMAALSRGVAGEAGGSLVLNLPGSPRGVRESLEAVLPVLPHAVELIRGATGPHPTGHEGAMGTSAVEAKAIRIVSGSPPCSVGARMSIVPGGEVRGTLGCAEFDSQAVEAAAEIAATGRPEVRTFHHDLGDVEVYLEPAGSRGRLVVVSATEVARSLRAHAGSLGLDWLLVESRTERLTSGDAPTASSIEAVDLSPADRVVLTDHDSPDVVGVLATALRSPAGFIGIMGSRRHTGAHVDRLRQMGFGDEDLARIHSPVGLDLGGRTPEEIAVSIAAGLVAASHGREGGWLG